MSKSEEKRKKVQKEEKVVDKLEDVKEAPKPTLDSEPKEKKVASGWVEVSKDELMKLQKEGKLAGYNPATKQALIK